MVINSISKGSVMGGMVSGFMVIFANPNPTNPCKAAATDKANTLIFLELSTTNTHKHPNMAHLLTKLKIRIVTITIINWRIMNDLVINCNV